MIHHDEVRGDRRPTLLEPISPEQPVEVELEPGDYELGYREPGGRWHQFSDKSGRSFGYGLIVEAGGPYQVTLDAERREFELELLYEPEAGADAAVTPRSSSSLLPVLPSPSNIVDSPVAGRWREVERLPCGGGPAYEPVQGIGELVVFAAGGLRLTWRAFETHFDYNAIYRLDPETNQIQFEVVGGSYVPGDMDRLGTYEMQGSRLILHMWLGSPLQTMGGRACGHVFE